MPRRTKIVATLGPASSDAQNARAHDRGRARRGAHEFLARHRRRARQARRTGARAGAQGAAARSACWWICRARKSASAASRTTKSSSRRATKFVLDAECKLGDQHAVGLDYKNLPQGRAHRRHAAARRRAHRAGRVRRSRARASPLRGRAGRAAVQQQGHQSQGRRPDRAGADREGHAGHQDRRRAQGGFSRRVVSALGRRHAAGRAI